MVCENFARKYMGHDNLLPCGHSAINEITHWSDVKQWSSCMFCEWRSDKPFTPKITIEQVLKNLIHDYDGLLLEYPSQEKEKDGIEHLVIEYARDLRNYALESFGRLGGEATARKYGKKHFSDAGKKGMAKRWGTKKD